MTTSALPFDLGLSIEAGWVRRRVYEAAEDVSSSASDMRQRRLLAALSDAVADAWQYDWDGEGGLPADASSLAYALEFLERLPAWLPEPDIIVDPDGEIGIDWDYGRRAVFSVSIGRDGTLSFAGLMGASKIHGTKPFTDEIPGIIISSAKGVLEQAQLEGESS